MSEFSGRSSWLQVLGGVLLFLLWGLQLVLGEIPRELTPGWLAVLRQTAFWGLLLLPPLGTLAGWWWDFPRWTYPYMLVSVLTGWYMTNASSPGIVFFGVPLFGRQVWGWRAWLPMLAALGFGLLLRRSLQPLRAFGQHIRQDWTVLTYGLFGCLPVWSWIVFDEMDSGYTLAFMVPIAVTFVLTAGIYLRIGRGNRRAWVLLSGSTLIVTLSALGPTLYWNRQMPGVNNPWTALLSIPVVLGFLFAPAVWMRLRAAAGLA